jgi:5'/3'-nucleotidase SurE
VNEGSNLGPLVYTLSGTLGAAYVAVGRGIPAIAVSGQNSTKVDYKDWDPEDESAVGELGSSVLESWALSRKTIADRLPISVYACVMYAANVQGRLTADLVSALAYGRDKTKGERVLP